MLDCHRNILKILELVLAPLPHLCSECLVLRSCRWFALLCKRYQILSRVSYLSITLNSAIALWLTFPENAFASGALAANNWVTAPIKGGE
jgi:hypothetical protein